MQTFYSAPKNNPVAGIGESPRSKGAVIAKQQPPQRCFLFLCFKWLSQLVRAREGLTFISYLWNDSQAKGRAYSE
jgi:hypothetical protein